MSVMSFGCGVRKVGKSRVFPNHSNGCPSRKISWWQRRQQSKTSHTTDRRSAHNTATSNKTTSTMSDDEHDYAIESTDAGASATIPMEAGQVKKGGYVLLFLTRWQ
jgi:hypothetical protein